MIMFNIICIDCVFCFVDCLVVGDADKFEEDLVGKGVEEVKDMVDLDEGVVEALEMMEVFVDY